jgi:PAS domain S-box-containing protein
VPQLNLTPLAFLPHMLLDMYALFRNDMFEFKPATRRTAERAAIDDVGTAVAIVDRQGRLINLNDAARETFGVEKREILAEPLEALYSDGDIDVSPGEQAVTLRADGRRREFDVTTTPLCDAAGTEVGYTATFQDVTAERQRKQRLGVLNRILRHNLRNDLSVVINYAEIIEARSDGDTAEYAGTIERTSADLVELGEKARRASAALDGSRDLRSFVVADVLADIAADLEEEYPSGTVACDVPSDLRIVADPRLFALVVRSLVENGLEHGSGIGLWLVSWGTTALGGDVSFETPEGEGTQVTLRIPDDRTA